MSTKLANRIRRLTATVVLLALVVPATIAQNDDDPPVDVVATEGSGLIRGKVLLAADGKPADGAIVHAYHLGSQQVYSSEPTDSRGKYELTELPFGYVDLFVEIPDGVFVANQVVSVPPAGKLTVTFTLSEYKDDSSEWWTGREPKQIAVLDKPASGIAEIEEQIGRKVFWKSPAGIAIIGGGSVLALLGIASSGGDDDEQSVSPSVPEE